jgi:predicted double-glycine peptidase
MHPVAHQTNLISIANSHQESFEEIKVFSDEDYQSQIYPENVAQTNDEDQPNILSPVMRRNHSYSFNH